jgi:hypothetical protein
MATWTAATNKQDTGIVAGPASSQTLTLGTPAAHSVLICLVAWTGAQTVTVSGGAGNAWASKPQIDNGSNHCQIWYVLNSANVATTCTATFTGNVTNIQLSNAEYPVAGPLTQGLVVVVDLDAHTATGSSTTPSTAALTATYGDELWIGYADNGTSSTWTAGTNYTIGSTAAARRSAIEHVVNATGSVVATAAWTNSSNTAWEAGAITFQVQSVGTGIVLPAIEPNSVQGPLIAATAGSKFGNSTDPYGSGPTGGANKPPGQQIGIASTHVSKR